MKDWEDYDFDLGQLMYVRDQVEMLDEVPYVRQAISYLDKAISYTQMKLSLLSETL